MAAAAAGVVVVFPIIIGLSVLQHTLPLPKARIGFRHGPRPVRTGAQQRSIPPEVERYSELPGKLAEKKPGHGPLRWHIQEKPRRPRHGPLCLNPHWLMSLAGAYEKLEDQRRSYNGDRPDSEISRYSIYGAARIAHPVSYRRSKPNSGFR